MALILPRRIYFKKVGFEILKYWIASSLVKTESLLMDDIEPPQFADFPHVLRSNKYAQERIKYARYITA